MTRLIVVAMLATIFSATPIEAQSEQAQSVPPFIALTVAVVADSITGSSETAVIVWGPQENGTDHLIMLPEDRATARELRNATAALLALVRNGESFEPGTWLRAGPASDPIGESVRSFNWVPRVIDDLETADRRTLPGLGTVAAAFVVVQVD